MLNGSNATTLALTATTMLIVLLTGCGSASKNADTPPPSPPATTVQRAQPLPLRCLASAGLTKLDKSGPYWRGVNDAVSGANFFQVDIQKLASAAAARSLVHDATAVYAAAAGRWVVTGPSKGTEDGSLIVGTVADCLKKA
jgi:hypothetical protein